MATNEENQEMSQFSSTRGTEVVDNTVPESPIGELWAESANIPFPDALSHLSKKGMRCHIYRRRECVLEVYCFSVARALNQNSLRIYQSTSRLIQLLRANKFLKPLTPWESTLIA